MQQTPKFLYLLKHKKLRWNLKVVIQCVRVNREQLNISEASKDMEKLFLQKFCGIEEDITWCMYVYIFFRRYSGGEDFKINLIPLNGTLYFPVYNTTALLRLIQRNTFQFCIRNCWRMVEELTQKLSYKIFLESTATCKIL